jgi:hypothetical protein
MSTIMETSEDHDGDINCSNYKVGVDCITESDFFDLVTKSYKFCQFLSDAAVSLAVPSFSGTRNNWSGPQFVTCDVVGNAK